MGSLNFAMLPLARRHQAWRFDWERPYLEASEGFVFRNTFADIRAAAETLGPEGVRFEHECNDVGHLYNLAHCLRERLFEPSVFVMGVLGGIAAEIRNLVFMLRAADRFFGGGYPRSVIGAGAAQMPMVAAAVSYGRPFARGAGGLAPHRAGGSRAPARSRSPRPAASWRGWATRSPRPSRRASAWV